MPSLAGYAHLAQDPGYCGGAPRVAEAGVRVVTILGLYRSGVPPEEIAERYEGLRIGAVFSALAYAADHRDEIDAYLAKEERVTADALRNQIPHPKIQAARERTQILP